jgi:putative transposase
LAAKSWAVFTYNIGSTGQHLHRSALGDGGQGVAGKVRRARVAEARPAERCCPVDPNTGTLERARPHRPDARQPLSWALTGHSSIRGTLYPMRTYKRIKIPGGTYFFTLTLAERQGNDLLVRYISALRTAFRQTLADHPVAIEAVVVLPDHLHCLWRLPPDDDDFPTRWRLIKSRFSRQIPPGERICASRARRAERGLWQRRYWEHVVRDEEDYRRHMDYIHFNPVKHGYVDDPRDWPYSSLHRLIARGVYDKDWAMPRDMIDVEFD